MAVAGVTADVREEFIVKRTVLVRNSQSQSEENNFVEFRRKVRAADMLSSAMERRLRKIPGLTLLRRGMT